MKVLRSSIIHPRPGREQAVHDLLHELDQYLSGQPGSIESYELGNDGDAFGRVAVWESREAADRAANQVHTIALRARLRRLSGPNAQEQLLEVVGEHHREAIAA